MAPRHPPATTDGFGLSPRRDTDASAFTDAQDVFAGVTDRHLFDDHSVLTIQIGALSHEASMAPKGSGMSDLSATGWRGNWVSRADHRAARYSVSVAWERLFTTAAQIHDVTLTASVAERRLHGTVRETPV